MAAWRAKNPEAARRSVAAMLTPEAKAKNLAQRRKYYQKRSEVRNRCEELMRKHGLDVAKPSGRANLQTWEDFEKRLRAMIKGV